MPPRKRKQRSTQSTASAAAAAEESTPMETTADVKEPAAGGGGGGGRGAKRARPTPTVAFPPTTAVLSAALNGLNGVTGLIPDLNAFISAYAAVRPLRWVKPKGLTKADAPLTMALSADGRVADAMELKASPPAAAHADPVMGEAAVTARLRVELAAGSAMLTADVVPTPINAFTGNLFTAQSVPALPAGYAMVSCRAARYEAPAPLTLDLKIDVADAGGGRLTLSFSGLPAAAPYRIEPHSRLLIAGYGVRVTILDSE